MAQAIPTAFDQHGKQFAISYAVVRLAGLGLYWNGLRERPAERAALWTFLPTSALGAGIVLIGGFVDPSARPWVWAVAVVIDVSSTIAAGRGDFRVSPAHFSERHALFVIIALGESIVAVGVAGNGIRPTTVGYVAAASAIVVIATLWWAYFDWVRAEAERALVDAPEGRAGRVARDLYTLGHIPIIAGTVIFAAGVEEAVQEPLEPFGSFGRWAVGGGIVLYLLGFVILHARIRSELLTERFVGAIVVAICMTVSGDRVDAVWILVVLVVLNLALTTSESLRTHRAAAEGSRGEP
jgi:low temperature requirement protein LtrA